MKSVQQRETSQGSVLIYQEDDIVLSSEAIKRICDQAIVVDTYDEDEGRIRTVYFAWEGDVPWVIWKALREQFFKVEQCVEVDESDQDSGDDLARFRPRINFSEQTLEDYLGDLRPLSEAAAKELLAGPLEAAREKLLAELTSARDALQQAKENGADAQAAIAAVEVTRQSLETLGARAFFAHEFLCGSSAHLDVGVMAAGYVCALAQEFPCDEASASEYLKYVDELIASLKFI